MSFTVTEIKERINILTDEYASSYLSDSKWTTLWNKASTLFFGKLLSKYGATKRIDENMQCIVASATAPVSTYEIDLTGVALPDYWKFINVKPTYVSGGDTYSEYARELKPSEKGSVYSGGSFMYPRYTFVQDAILLYPETGTCATALVEYFRKPFDVDFSNPNDTAPYDSDTLDRIILEFANQLSIFERDDAFSAQIENEINQGDD